jgi:hypothetical protein
VSTDNHGSLTSITHEDDPVKGECHNRSPCQARVPIAGSAVAPIDLDAGLNEMSIDLAKDSTEVGSGHTSSVKTVSSLHSDCPGFKLKLPEGQSPYTSYPLASRIRECTHGHHNLMINGSSFARWAAKKGLSVFLVVHVALLVTTL